MIVYKFNVLLELKAHGYTQYKLKKCGLLSTSAMAALKDSKPISFDSLNTICRLLNKQVSDIIEYQPDKE